MSNVRDRLNQFKQSPVTTELMPALIGAGKIATVKGFTQANALIYGDNKIEGDLAFDSVIDGNSTSAELMNGTNDGLNLRIYRINEARIMAKSQGLYPIEELIPVCFCPTFSLMKDNMIGNESIDDYRENLRLATIAIYSEKNFPTRVNTYRRAQPEYVQSIPMPVANYIMDFEKQVTISGGDNWYSAPFTILFSVVIKNFI